MPEKPVHDTLSRSLVGDLAETLAKPFHPEFILPTPSGHSTLGLKVGKSWIKHRDGVALGGLPENEPVETTAGVWLPEFYQARFYLQFTGAGAPTGTERLSTTIWHRHRAYDDSSSPGPWVRWKDLDSLRGVTETLDTALYHREVYIQLRGYIAGGSPATNVTVWVAGAADLFETSLVDVKVDVKNIEVHTEAIPDDPGEASDSMVCAGVTDGSIKDFPATDTVYALRVRKGGYVDPWLNVESYQGLIRMGDTLDVANIALAYLEGQAAYARQYGQLGAGRARYIPLAPTVGSADQMVRRVLNPQGYGLGVDFGQLWATGYRKIMGTGGVGAFTPPATGDTTVTFTGVNLAGRVLYVIDEASGVLHTVVGAVTDPAPPAVGSFVITPAIQSAAPRLIIPFLDQPHAYSTPTDAIRSEPIIAPPRGVNGPATLVDLSGAAITDGTYTYPFFMANYGYVSVSAIWTNNDAAERGRLDIEARLDDSVATPNWRNVNSKFAVGTGASPGGVADTALATPVQNGQLLAECAEPQKAWRELRCIYTKSASVAGNDTLRIVHFMAR